MLKVENVEVVGWEHAIRGMRNPLNSWKKSDSEFCILGSPDYEESIAVDYDCEWTTYIGPNDLYLMKSLHDAGTDHRKFMRMLVVYVDITAPLYWWKEFDTYKVGTVANSCSTMHTIHKKEFDISDFSGDHLINDWYDLDYCDCVITSEPDSNGQGPAYYFDPSSLLEVIVNMLNKARELYLQTKDKMYWWQMIQLLPSSYNQKRTVMLNYEVLANIYKSRKNHKLDEWHEFCNWAKNLPLADLLIVDDDDDEFSDENIRKFFKKVQKIDSKAFSYSVSKFSGNRKIVCICNSSGELRWSIDSAYISSLDQAYTHIKDFLEKADEQTRG